MKKALIAAAVMCGLCAMCSGGLVVLGLAADDPAEPGGGGGAARSTPAGCSDTFEGWHQDLTQGGIVLTKGGVTAELPWAFTFTDAMRQGRSEINVFNLVAGSRYRDAKLQGGSYGDQRLAGSAIETATGRTVYVAFTTGASSGVANPVFVVGPDDSVLRAYPTSSELDAVRALNRFSLGCAELEGRWKSGSSTAAERYAAGTGQYLGVTAIAGASDLQLGSGSYERESRVYLHGVFTKKNDSGDWSHDDWSVTLEPSGADAVRYNASFIAVQNGFLLRLQNQKFAGEVEDFTRVE